MPHRNYHRSRNPYHEPAANRRSKVDRIKIEIDDKGTRAEYGQFITAEASDGSLSAESVKPED